MIQHLKRLFVPPSAEVIALKELDDARRSLLEALSGREYAESMVTYHKARIKRLSAYLHAEVAHEQTENVPKKAP